MEQSVVETE